MRKSEVHPGKEAGAFHPENRDEDAGDEDEEDNDSCDIVQAVQALLVGLLCDVSPGCNTHTRTKTRTKYTKTCRQTLFRRCHNPACLPTCTSRFVSKPSRVSELVC